MLDSQTDDYVSVWAGCISSVNMLQSNLLRTVLDMNVIGIRAVLKSFGKVISNNDCILSLLLKLLRYIFSDET
jgi:hypothetical protein